MILKGLDDLLVERTNALRMWNSRFDKLSEELTTLQEEFIATPEEKRKVIAQRYRLKLDELMRHARAYEILPYLAFWNKHKKNATSTESAY